MNAVNLVTRGALVLPSQPTDAVGPTSANGLTPPTLEALDPSDPMGQLMAMLERMNQLSTQQTERELRQAGDQMKEQLDKFLKLIADAIRQAQQTAKKKKKKKGFFKKLCSSVASVVGGTLGKALATITMSPSLEKKIEGFTRGALSFSADLAAFNAKLAIALATDGPDAAKAWDDVKAEAKELWESFQENCLENPDFMEIVGYLAKAGALAAAVGSGGALAWVAVGVFLLCEVDNRTNFVEDVFGEEAAPWVRLGMNVAASVLTGMSGGSAAVRYLQAGTAVIQGASDINAGIKMLEEGEREAEELRHEANLLETLNRMQQFQRLIDDLLAEMQDHAENKGRTRELSNGVVELQAAANEAVILRA
jgi:hypothetical protein